MAPVVYASGKNHFSLSCMADTMPDLRLPPAAGHHRLLTGTKLYCLVTEAWVRCSGVLELLPTKLRKNNFFCPAIGGAWAPLVHASWPGYYLDG